MATILSTEQAAKLTTTSTGGRYSREQWDTYVENAAEQLADGGALVNTEEDFPGIKWEHVRHMFRIVLKDNPELAEKIAVGKNDEQGVFLKAITQPTEA